MWTDALEHRTEDIPLNGRSDRRVPDGTGGSIDLANHVVGVAVRGPVVVVLGPGGPVPRVAVAGSLCLPARLVVIPAWHRFLRHQKRRMPPSFEP